MSMADVIISCTVVGVLLFAALCVAVSKCLSRDRPNYNNL
jgi:hypothetical protein